MDDPIIEEIAFGTERYRQATELRRELLRKPLGLDFAPEDLAREIDDRHLAAIVDGRVVGTLLLRAVDATTFRLMQMAVADDMQGRGVGAALVRNAERIARDAGVEKMRMHARATAIGFYERCGYTKVSGEFVDLGIPHVRMEKRL